MDLSQEFDIEDLIPAIVIGAVESVQSQRTPQMTGQAGREYGFLLEPTTLFPKLPKPTTKYDLFTRTDF
jgi:hypothetical protein